MASGDSAHFPAVRFKPRKQAPQLPLCLCNIWSQHPRGAPSALGQRWSACYNSEPGLQHFTESDQRDIMQDYARGCARHDREVARRAWRTNRMLGARMAWPAKALLPLTPRHLAGMGTAPHSAQEHKVLRCQGPRWSSGCPQGVLNPLPEARCAILAVLLSYTNASLRSCLPHERVRPRPTGSTAGYRCRLCCAACWLSVPSLLLRTRGRCVPVPTSEYSMLYLP